jgi:hypothetical protein
MKEQAAGYSHTQRQPRKILGGLDMEALAVPLVPADIPDIAQRRRDAQARLRERIDQGVITDG